jgi:hypothetical protein
MWVYYPPHGMDGSPNRRRDSDQLPPAHGHKCRHIVGPRYQKAPVSFLTEALILSLAILLFALLPLSVRDRRSGRHTEFGQLSRVAYLRDEPGLWPETC